MPCLPSSQPGGGGKRCRKRGGVGWGLRLAARWCEVMGEDGSTPALGERDSTWPPPGPPQAQLLKRYARQERTGREKTFSMLIHSPKETTFCLVFLLHNHNVSTWMIYVWGVCMVLNHVKQIKVVLLLLRVWSLDHDPSKMLTWWPVKWQKSQLSHSPTTQ